MSKQYLQLAYGATGVFEALITAVRCFGASASDIIQIITNLFGFVLPLPVAIALRVLIATTSGYALIDGIKRICPQLYRAIKSKRRKSYV